MTPAHTIIIIESPGATYADALAELTSTDLPSKDRKHRKQMLYRARRGEPSIAKYHALQIINRDLLATIEMLIFGREIKPVHPNPAMNWANPKR